MSPPSSSNMLAAELATELVLLTSTSVSL